MRTPLRYQATEYDCGPTAVLNAITYLYSTEEIPPDFVKAVYNYCLDEYNDLGCPGRHGTSQAAIRFMTEWFNNYARCTGYPLRCEYFQGEDVHMQDHSQIIACLEQGGAAVVRCILECEHYITLTGIDSEYVHVFDPYFWDMDFGKKGIVQVTDKPFEMNRKISRNIMDCTDDCDYSFCKTENRTAMLRYKTGKGKVLLP